MFNVEVYDSYPPIYSDNTDGKLKVVYLKHREEIDSSRYTLVYPCSSSSVIYENNLDLEGAYSFAFSLYEDSKNLGISYEDKLIKLEEGYAELRINLADNKVIHRVILTKES